MPTIISNAPFMPGEYAQIASGHPVSRLAAGKHLALKEVGHPDWYIALGDVAGTVALGWPASHLTNAEGDVITWSPIL